MVLLLNAVFAVMKTVLLMAGLPDVDGDDTSPVVVVMAV